MVSLQAKEAIEGRESFGLTRSAKDAVLRTRHRRLAKQALLVCTPVWDKSRVLPRGASQISVSCCAAR